MWDYIIQEIHAGRPLMIGFSGQGNSPYPPHMTVCVGYEITDGKKYIYVSDAHISEYRRHELSDDYNDFIATVHITEE